MLFFRASFDIDAMAFTQKSRGRGIRGALLVAMCLCSLWTLCLVMIVIGRSVVSPWIISAHVCVYFDFLRKGEKERLAERLVLFSAIAKFDDHLHSLAREWMWLSCKRSPVCDCLFNRGVCAKSTSWHIFSWSYFPWLNHLQEALEFWKEVTIWHGETLRTQKTKSV